MRNFRLDRFIENIKNKKIEILFFALYFAISLVGITRHEMFRDEAQAWLIAKNLNIVELFNILSVEGHPCLWFLILKVLYIFGVPYSYLDYFSFFIMLIAAYLMLFNSPFTIIEKIAFLVSSCFFYYNTSISRIYCICMLIGVLIAINYKDRCNKPILYNLLVALLLQTHIKISGLAIGLMLSFLYELIFIKKEKKTFKYLLIPFVSLLFLVFELYPRTQSAVTKPLAINSSLIIKLVTGFFDMYCLIPDGFGINNCVSGIPVLIILIIIIKNIISKKDREMMPFLIIYSCGIGAYMIITIMVYQAHRQMASLLCLIHLLLLWIIYLTTKENKYRILFAVVSFIVCAYSGIYASYFYIKDIKENYSNALDMSCYIKNNLEDNAVILVSYDSRNPSVIAYTNEFNPNIDFYDIETKKKYTVHNWNNEYEFDKTDLKDTYLLFDNRNVYYLSSSEMEDKCFEEVYSNLDFNDIKDERYILYKLNIGEN